MSAVSCNPELSVALDEIRAEVETAALQFNWQTVGLRLVERGLGHVLMSEIKAVLAEKIGAPEGEGVE